MESIISQLFEEQWGKKPENIELLPASGSARKYFRLTSADKTYIAAFHQNIPENRLFINFTKHFDKKGLNVPKIYAVSADESTYIQEDLGNTMLLDIVERERKGEYLSEHLLTLYKKSLSELLRFQLLGGEGLDYSACIPRPIFDRQCIQWDLNYFKYCFLRLAGADFSEQALEEDFNQLTDALCQEPADTFMFRDFQSRNIMVRDEEVWFIDYQGGRRGALQYDVASLLYDAIIAIPASQREELLDDYIAGLQEYKTVDTKAFRIGYYRFVLIRLLQAMGAFGLRGLYEKKQHFIDSIIPGLQHISTLFDSGKLGNEYPEIHRVIRSVSKIENTLLSEG
ncbi:MAG: phosphotransferase [Odoribacter sp.]